MHMVLPICLTISRTMKDALHKSPRLSHSPSLANQINGPSGKWKAQLIEW
jgi:hypothetical protein